METKVAKYDLRKLIQFVESKHVAVPEFQRGFVWKKRKLKPLKIRLKFNNNSITKDKEDHL